MKILIDIPDAFEVDYNADRFVDFFQRCIADMGTCCGNFELDKHYYDLSKKRLDAEMAQMRLSDFMPEVMP